MFNKSIFILVVCLLVTFIAPIIDSYDFKQGFNKEYLNIWINDNIIKEYDMSKIQAVNSMQTQSISYEIGAPFEQNNYTSIESEYKGRFALSVEGAPFHMVLVSDDKITGLYTSSNEVSINNINIQGMNKDKIRDTYGKNETFIQQGNHKLAVESDEYDVFNLIDSYLYVFYDIHNNNTVNGVLLVNKEEMNYDNALYNSPSELDYEIMHYHVLNGVREGYHINLLSFDDKLKEAAKAHSLDMATNNYFSHTSLDGSTLKERLVNQNTQFLTAGENLAMGHTSPIFAVHSLLNSKGHRENILKETFTHVGIGVNYAQDDTPYYVENYKSN